MTTSDLVLPSLQIQGFRIFKDTTVKKLERVNLIVGKNNVGKTSFLEALWLYARRASPVAIGDHLIMREECTTRSRANEAITSSTALQNIFHDETEKSNPNQHIQIGSLKIPENIISISISMSMKNKFLDVGIGGQGCLSIQISNIVRDVLVLPKIEDIPHIFISPKNLTNEQITTLWDKIALTNHEDEVVRALQIIAPDVERINMISDPAIGPQRIAMIRLKERSKPLPLRSYGDGMNRLFVLALAVANASDGLLLIDEIENGLHYSVQFDVWRLIFDLAHRLNIQVFATTHSWDCVEAFQKAAAEHPKQGQIIRLGRKQDSIVATRFDEQELAIITRDQIEVR